MRKFKKHIVADMNESMVQRCLVCGTIICDYREVMYRKEDGPPKGYAAGEICVSEGHPTITAVPEFVGKNAIIIPCT